MDYPNLSVTMMDVGWGDSILLEANDQNGEPHYALVDSNDHQSDLSAAVFLKKFFERKGWVIADHKPVFEFIMLSHAHADHGQGLKNIMRQFGTLQFWYPKSIDWSSLTDLLRFSQRSSDVEHHEALNNGKNLPDLGNVKMEVLWPPDNQMDQNNENNNSIIMTLKLGQVSFLLTGDAEEDVWQQIAGRIPPDTRFFKVPHHGSRNGSLNAASDSGAWLGSCPRDAMLGISCHLKPFDHPHPKVIQLFENGGRAFYRTDTDYHLTFTTDGRSVAVKYSR
jgi:beta-lactamase superfamily II metal-dependent hydrolase